MKESIQMLFTIQGYELKKQQLLQELAYLNSRIHQEEQAMIVEKNNLLAFTQDLNEKIKQSECIDQEIEQLENSIIECKAQQISAKQKQYESISKVLESYQKQLVEKENFGLELLESIDQAKMLLENQEFQKKISTYEATLENFNQQKIQLKLSISETDGKIEALKQLVPDKALLEQFITTLQGLEKFPIITELKSQHCEGCHMKLSGTLMDEIRLKEDDIVCCDSCSRMIYIPKN